ncbi:MAG: hypothetical protein H0T79_00955, partial [Deltaproteobacteria bacterium]|nr:hypothetical protein [Deltaproteobacteria bacterium]
MTRVAVVLGFVMVVAGGAHGDSLYSAQPLVEVSHAVDVRIDAGVATYKVTR